jgi:hypothetical protein
MTELRHASTSTYVGIIDSATNSIMQRIAMTLKREGHPGGLGDSRRLRELVAHRVAALETEMVDADIATLISTMSESIPEWVSFVLEDRHPQTRMDTQPQPKTVPKIGTCLTRSSESGIEYRRNEYASTCTRCIKRVDRVSNKRELR